MPKRTFYIPDELCKRMHSTNWSKVVQNAIEQEILSEEFIQTGVQINNTANQLRSLQRHLRAALHLTESITDNLP